MKPFRYRIVVEWSDEDAAFIGRVPALSGCAAHGETPDQAAREVQIAAEGIVTSLRAHGDAVPTEDIAADFSGQLRLRLPSSLHAKLARLAAADGVSLNHELVALLAEGCGGKVKAGTGRRARPERNQKGRLNAG